MGSAGFIARRTDNCSICSSVVKPLTPYGKAFDTICPVWYRVSGINVVSVVAAVVYHAAPRGYNHKLYIVSLPRVRVVAQSLALHQQHY